MNEDLSRGVFLNFPYDTGILPVLQATVFTVMECECWPRCALEYQGANRDRLGKIIHMCRECPRSIHDLTPAFTDSGIARQNMSLELGIALACAEENDPAGGERHILIMAGKRNGLDEALSDLRGRDIVEHGGQPVQVIREVREWFLNTPQRLVIPAAADICARFAAFQAELPEMMRLAKFDPAEPLGLTGFRDYREFVGAWLERNDRSRV